MTEIVTVEKIENLDTDIMKAGQATNEDTIVKPRYGNEFKSFPMVSREAQENLTNAVRQVIETGGFEPFATEVELLASTPTLTKKAAKALDTKKVWLWDGKWNDTGSSEKDLANQYTDKKVTDLTINNLMQSAFYTYENQNVGSIFISNNNKIVLPAPVPVSELNITAENIEAAQFNSFYLDLDTVKKRFERHPVQDISNTTEYWSKSVEKLYAQYDKLITNYPDYVEKELLGNEPTGLPIYAYSFKPTKKLLRVHQQSVMEYPKVVIIGGVHGNERGCQITNLTFFTMLCESYLQSEVLTNLRHNVEFYLIPASNAWGVQNGKRFNSNYVDLNRNFDSNWKAGTGTVSNESFTYGTSAFSEIESQITRDYVLKHADACLVLDTHDGGSAEYFAWIATMHETMIEVFKKTSYEIITMIYRDLHPQKIPPYPLLFAGHEDGTMTKWAMMQGIKSGLLETNGNNENFNDDVSVKRDIFLKILQILFKNSVDTHIQKLILGAVNA